MEKLIERIEREIEQLEYDTYYVKNNVSIGVLENAIKVRREKLEELKNK